MAKFIDIATDAFQKIGYYAPGESIDDDDAELALRVANDMLDSWSNETLSCFAYLTQSVTLNPPQSVYAIGPGAADINGTRPIRLNMGPGAAWLMDNIGNRYGIEVVPYDKWIWLTSNTLVNSNVPNYLYYDSQDPIGFLNFWPVPNINWTAYWTSYLQLTDFSVLTSPFTFPPGYKKAIQDCLAVELFPYCFKGDMPPQIVVELASKSKGNIKRSNIRENVAIYDPELVSRSANYYNIFTDDSTNGS